MADPAGYPRNDSAETASVNLTNYLIDPDLVKTTFGHRDKFPNIDGFVELIRRDGKEFIPCGKLDVQIKTLPAGELKYSCPASLVAYSETVTLPLLLICADAANERVFWKHIHRGMAEFKENQVSFVVRFDPVVDAIDDRKTYVTRWYDLAEDYRTQMKETTVLKKDILEQLGLGKIPPAEVTAIQLFIDRVNFLLDGELNVVKAHYFPNIWKIGVAVYKTSATEFGYHLYSIPFGSGSPLIVSLPGRDLGAVLQSLHQLKPDPLGLAGFGQQQFVGSRWQMRASGFDPVATATNCALGYLKEMVTKRSFRLAGRVLPTESVFAFMDAFAHTTGVPIADAYELAALNYGLKVYFRAWYRLALNRYVGLHGQHLQESGQFPPFESIAGMMPPTKRPTPTDVQAQIQAADASAALLIRCQTFNWHSIIEAVDLLLADGTKEISRVHGLKSGGGTHVWDGYGDGEAATRLETIAGNALGEYRALLTRNSFRPSRSHFLGETQANLYQLLPRKADDGSPIVEHLSYRLPHGGPKMGFSNWTSNKGNAVVDGVTVEMEEGGSACAGTLFDRTPILSAVYGMLESDLATTYGLKRWTNYHSFL